MKSVIYKGKVYDVKDTSLPEEAKKRLGIKETKKAEKPKAKKEDK